MVFAILYEGFKELRQSLLMKNVTVHVTSQVRYRKRLFRVAGDSNRYLQIQARIGVYSSVTVVWVARHILLG